jgi:hypothetical protein
MNVRTTTDRKEATHIIQKYPSQQAELLYRAYDGVGLGHLEKLVIVWGEEPNKRTSRVFIDHDSAKRYLREVICRDDVAYIHGADVAVIFEEDKEDLVTLAPGSLEFPNLGASSLRKM